MAVPPAIFSFSMISRYRVLPIQGYLLALLAFTLAVLQSLDLMGAEKFKCHHKCTPWYSLFLLIFTIYANTIEADDHHRRRMCLQGMFLFAVSWIDVFSTWHSSGGSWVYLGNRVTSIAAHSAAVAIAAQKHQVTGSAW